MTDKSACTKKSGLFYTGCKIVLIYCNQLAACMLVKW